MSTHFFSEGVVFNLKGKRLLKKWILYIIEAEGKKLGDISYIFASDDFVRDINYKYLNHNYNTDIVTFNYNKGIVLNSDIYISIDTVRENSIIYNVSFENELERVIIHGVLHLIGYDDINEQLQRIMRNKEDYALDILNSKFRLK